MSSGQPPKEAPLSEAASAQSAAQSGSAGPAGFPEELRFALGFLPSATAAPLQATHAPTGHLPTPGMTSGVTRVPSAPTLPDWDPAQLGQVMLRLANEIFTTSPAEHGTMPAEHQTSYPSGVLAPSAMEALPAAAFGNAPPWQELEADGDDEEPGVIAPQMSAAGAPSASSASPAMNPLAPSSALAPAHGSSAQSPLAATALSLPAAAAVAPASPSSAAAALPWLAEATPGALPFSAPLDDRALSAALEPSPAFTLPFFDAAPAAASSDAPYWLPPAPAPSGATELSLPFDLAAAPAASPAPPAAPAPSITSSAPASAQPPALARRPSSDLFDPHAIRRQFPILKERVNGRPLVWLDNAATTQKPQAVIDRLSYFYERENSNIHRAAHTLAARSTEAYEKARDSVRRFIGAGSVEEIIFVRGATEGINLIAQSWGRQNLGAGDEIILTNLEHHANIVPWQQLAAVTGARLRVAPVDDSGQILLDEYARLFTAKTRLVAMTHVSNALGTITPARQMIEMAHRRGVCVLLDGAQAVSHQRVDVAALDCDFYVFSGHKVFAPTGIGAVYAKRKILDDMPPWQGGGNMIADVTFEKTTYQGPPARFEAGTGNIADAVGLGAALDWLTSVGIDNVDRYEHELLAYATDALATVPGLRMIGTAKEKAGVLSFTLAGQHTQSVGGLLDREGIAVRSGHHCAQPILRRFGVEATVRASLAPYNLREDIDALVDALHRLQANR